MPCHKGWQNCGYVSLLKVRAFQQVLSGGIGLGLPIESAVIGTAHCQGLSAALRVSGQAGKMIERGLEGPQLQKQKCALIVSLQVGGFESQQPFVDEYALF